MTTPDGTFDPGPARTAIDREWGSALRHLADLTDDAWLQPTRLHRWTILDLARHTVWGVTMEADALRRARTGERDPADGLSLAEDSAPADVLEALNGAVVELGAELGKLGEDDAQLVAPMPYGEVPVGLVLDVYVFEAAIHSNDVAHAVGADHPLADDVLAPITRVLHGFLPAFAAASQVDPPEGSSVALVGSSVRIDVHWSDGQLVVGAGNGDPTATVSGDDSSVLLFAVGRVTADDARLTVQGSADLARDFKVLVPGP